MSAQFLARSASDRTDDWPHWFVVRANEPRKNVLREACEIARIHIQPGAVLTTRLDAECIARMANHAEESR